MGDIIVLCVLGLIVGVIIAGMVRDKKKGKSCACSGCSGCKNGCGCSGK